MPNGLRIFIRIERKREMGKFKLSQRFIKLHQLCSGEEPGTTGEVETYVLARNIESIEASDGGSMVTTPSTTVVVKESPDEILKLMDEL